MASPIKNNPFTVDQHLQFFAEFCKGVEYGGGTTPHMLMTVEAARRHESLTEQLWWAGCYAFVYNFATAEILWVNHDPTALDKYDQPNLEDWIIKHKPGIKMRKERKAVYAPRNLSICMLSYVDYIQQLKSGKKEWFFHDDMPNRYQTAYDDICSSVKYIGRYIGIRWLEVIRRVFNMPNMEMPDLRSAGGDHPRKALALMYPEYEPELMGGNDIDTLAIVDDVAAFCLEDLKGFGVTTDYYTIQSLLCEYKQSCLGKRQYPGKSIDTAMAYFTKVYEYWGEEEAEKSIMWDVRKAIFPKEFLGELQGWNGVRNELGNVLVDYGYTWSDYIFDYKATNGDYASPVYRGEQRSIL